MLVFGIGKLCGSTKRQVTGRHFWTIFCDLECHKVWWFDASLKAPEKRVATNNDSLGGGVEYCFFSSLRLEGIPFDYICDIFSFGLVQPPTSFGLLYFIRCEKTLRAGRWLFRKNHGDTSVVIYSNELTNAQMYTVYSMSVCMLPVWLLYEINRQNMDKQTR